MKKSREKDDLALNLMNYDDQVSLNSGEDETKTLKDSVSYDGVMKGPLSFVLQ